MVTSSQACEVLAQASGHVSFFLGDRLRCLARQIALLLAGSSQLDGRADEQRPRWRTDSPGGAVDGGTRLENDCLSSPPQRVLLGSTPAADIYCLFAERLLWFCSALSSLPGQVPTHDVSSAHLCCRIYLSFSLKSATWSLLRLGVAVWGSAIQRFRKRCSDPDGSMKSRNKAGRSGKSYCIACNAARFTGPKRRLEKVSE